MCENCTVKEFVHADLYCQDCEKKPAKKTRTGIAYLFMFGKSEPIASADVVARVGMEYEYSAVELMRNFKIEFIGD